MHLWRVLLFATLIGCGADPSPLPDSSSGTNTAGPKIKGIFEDNAKERLVGHDAKAAVDLDGGVRAPVTVLDAAAPPQHEPVAPLDASVSATMNPTTRASAAKDAGPATTVRDASKIPQRGTPDAAGAGPSQPPDAQLAQLVQLLTGAESPSDERAALGLMGLMLAQAQTAADLDRMLVTLISAGQCSSFGAALCAGACQMIAPRCALCGADAACATHLQSVCGVPAAACG